MANKKITGRKARKKVVRRSDRSSPFNRFIKSNKSIKNMSFSAEEVDNVSKDIDYLIKEGRKYCSDTNFDSYSTTINFDPAFAAYLLERCSYVRQRRIKNNKIKRFVRDIYNDNWRSISIINISVIKDEDGNDVPYLINGQHRAKAVIEIGQPIEVTISIVFRDNFDEVNEDYKAIDNTPGRSNNDRNRADGLHLKYNIPETYIACISNAIVHIISGFDKDLVRYARMDHSIRSRAIEDYIDDGLKYLKCIKGSDIYQKIKIAPIMSVGMITFCHKPRKANEFWSIVARGNDHANHPAMKLREFIILSNNRDRNGNKKNVSFAEYSRIVAYCWNKFINRLDIENTSFIVNINDAIRIDGCVNYSGIYTHMPYGFFFDKSWKMPKKVIK